MLAQVALGEALGGNAMVDQRITIVNGPMFIDAERIVRVLACDAATGSARSTCSKLGVLKCGVLIARSWLARTRLRPEITNLFPAQCANLPQFSFQIGDLGDIPIKQVTRVVAAICSACLQRPAHLPTTKEKSLMLLEDEAFACPRRGKCRFFRQAFAVGF